MKEVKCKKCKHEWKTKSKLVKVSCPSCGDKIILIELERGTRKNEKI